MLAGLLANVLARRTSKGFAAISSLVAGSDISCMIPALARSLVL
jgi:hypothetical protein